MRKPGLVGEAEKSTWLHSGNSTGFLVENIHVLGTENFPFRNNPADVEMNVHSSTVGSSWRLAVKRKVKHGIECGVAEDGAPRCPLGAKGHTDLK